MFKVGDKVKGMGVDGVVVGVGVAEEEFPIWVSFENGEEGRLTRDGKYFIWHKEPSLVLVERAAKFEEVVGYSAVCKSISTDIVTSPAIIATSPVIYATKEDVFKHIDNAIGYQEVKYFRKVE